MNNIWRNARHLNNLVQQIESTKQIQRPSDDPMRANRALRYRTILSENEQFVSNVDRGLAWMEVTESSFNNILTGTPSNPSIMQRLYTRLVEAAQTGTNHIEDQRAMIEEMRQFLYQLTEVEMNQTYMGRYVFSGFHTDQPPVLRQDNRNANYVVQQTFQLHDIETTIAFHRPNPTTRPVTFEGVHIMKLPFANNDITTLNFANTTPAGVPDLGISVNGFSGFTILERNSTDPDAYIPEDFDAASNPVIHFIRDTGELVMSDEVRQQFFASGEISVTYEVNGLREGDLNPRIYFPSWDMSTNPPAAFHAASESIELEISARSHITINSHASNVITDKLVADLRRLIDFADSLVSTDSAVLREFYGATYTGDDLTSAIVRFESDENTIFAGMMHDRINNMLESVTRYMADAQREQTNLGSRMMRTDMIRIRLEEDEISYTALLSETIDTDIAGTIVRKDGAEAAFNNALFAISRATQLSLADFINR